ncbi:MAG: glycoside hydrolase family 88 protein [Bacteroidota bacterium]|nr:glycoside hydrolase family 88 protein [Bacteroidota bacterium]
MRKSSKLFCTIVATLFVVGAFAQTQKVDKNLPWSVRMTKSDIIRNPKAWMLDFTKELKWNYCQGLGCQAFLDVYDRYGDKSLYNYVKAYTDTIIDKDGKILTYNKNNYSLDMINPGKILFRMYARTGDKRLKNALDSLYSQLKTHPRTPQGGFWHKKVYPNQMWLDGLYMGAPFYAEYNKTFNHPKAQADVVNQFLFVAKHTYDPKTGLFRHAWDASKAMPWADKTTGQAPNVWGRAMGWYMMAIVDALDFLPKNQPGRDSMIVILQNGAKSLLKYQDKTTGAWYQVLDMPDRKGNYQEATCTSMFTYALLKGVRKGYLPAQYRAVALKAYNGLIKNFIKVDDNGIVSLTRCCGVAGLGGNPYRDGSFDYYVHELIRDNDPKGVGPFIMASLEVESLNKNKK